MEPNDIESPAQDLNAPDGQQEETIEQKESKRNEGVEKRIAELTATIHEERRQKEAVNNQLNAVLTSKLINANQAPPEDKYKDMDPTVRAMVEDITGSIKREFGQQLAQSNARFEGMQLAESARAITLKATGSHEVADEAAKFAADMRRKNLPINEEDASRFAIGDAVMRGTYKPGQTAQPQSNRGTPVLTGNRSANLSQRQQSAGLPKNYDSLSLDEQIAVHEKLGTGDQPL